MASISVVGLGKLGSPVAATLAARGHKVIGVDSSERNVQMIREGRAPVAETGLQELVSAVGAHLTATTDYDEAIRNTEITFLVVPTPSGPDGGFSLDYVLPAMRALGEALAKKDGFHLVVLTSTVMPGSTAGPILAELARASGKTCGKDFGLCYNPEFIALGSVIRDLRNPDFVLIGESDPRSGEILAQLYETWCDNKPPIARMNWVNAEIAKLAVNTFVTTKISYANMLAQVCERLPEANVDVVTTALGLDSRIGGKYLKGGARYGGPCFPRDNRAFASLAQTLGAEAGLARATDQLNHAQVAWVAHEIRERLQPGDRVGILGLAYKPDTNIAEESQGVGVARNLALDGVSVVAYDPAAMDQARALLSDVAERVEFAETADECLQRCRVVVIATPWAQFREAVAQGSALGRGRVLVDCWRMLGAEASSAEGDYVPLGVGLATPHAVSANGVAAGAAAYAAATEA